MLMHGCVEIKVYSSRIDLQKNHPLEEADWTLYADGSSYEDTGNKKAGYAVVTLEGVVEAKALPQGTSAQKAELTALRRALALLHKRRVHVYTNLRYTS